MDRFNFWVGNTKSTRGAATRKRVRNHHGDQEDQLNEPSYRQTLVPRGRPNLTEPDPSDDRCSIEVK
jgi:hypothetical protein